MIELLEWDSHFFGYKVGRLYPTSPAMLGNALIQAKQKGYRLIDVRTPVSPEWTDHCTQAGGILVDKKTHLERITPSGGIAPLPEILAYKQVHSCPALDRLALASGTYSRFRIDRNFCQQEFERLYLHWVAKCINDPNCSIWIYGNYQGMISLCQKEQTMQIILLAVLPNYQRGGIGKKLIQQAFYVAQQAACLRVHTTTQGLNPKSMHFYAACGFRVLHQELVFHFWME